MNSVDLVAAFMLGAVGSLHCIGMCGPLALAVPGSNRSRWAFFGERVVFNLGRIVTYGVMGTVLGLVGTSLLIGVQQELSIVLGVFVLLTVLVPYGFRSRLGRWSPLDRVYAFTQRHFASFLAKKGWTALFTLGLLNGLLPCGLVYTALVGATAEADPVQSALFMMVFGAATAPALIIVAFTGRVLAVKYRTLLTRAVPVLTVVLAAILILRGMNLGIPMVSPKVTQVAAPAAHDGGTPAEPKTEVDCCE